MGTQGGDATESVRRWIETSGRAFELRVARAFRKHGTRMTEQTFQYTDPVSGQRREGDVRSTYLWESVAPKRAAALTVIAECKSSTKHPWVAFFDDRLRLGADLDSWTFSHHANDTRVVEPLRELWIGRTPFDGRQPATHIVTAHEGDKNTAGDAVRQCMSAAEAQRQAWIAAQGQPTNPLAQVIVTVVVTAAPLFECRLGPGGDVLIEPVKQVSVWGDSDRGRRHVYVMSEQQVPRFAASLADAVEVAAEDAELRRVH